MRTANLGIVGRNVLRAVPFLSLFFTIHFSSVRQLFSYLFRLPRILVSHRH